MFVKENPARKKKKKGKIAGNHIFKSKVAPKNNDNKNITENVHHASQDWTIFVLNKQTLF